VLSASHPHSTTPKPRLRLLSSCPVTSVLFMFQLWECSGANPTLHVSQRVQKRRGTGSFDVLRKRGLRRPFPNVLSSHDSISQIFNVQMLKIIFGLKYIKLIIWFSERQEHV
jgi:hypothetical protein